MDEFLSSFLSLQLLSSFRDADQRYNYAYTALRAELNAAALNVADDLPINMLAMESAIQNLNEQHESWLLAIKNIRDFIETGLQQFRQLEVANQNIPVDPNAVARSRDMAIRLAILNSKEQLHLLHFNMAMIALRDFIDTEAEDTYATEAAPVSTANSQPSEQSVLSSKDQGDMESEPQLEDKTEVSEEHKMTVSQTLANLDLNRPEPEETVKHNKDALQVLSDLDPNEKA